MATQQPSILVQMAKDLLAQAEQLQSELDKANIVCPGSTPEAPSRYPSGLDYPDLYDAQQELATTSRRMLQLSLGPTDYIRSVIGSDRTALPVLRVIDHFKIQDLVPHHGSIPMTALATQLNLHPPLLARILRRAFTHHFFTEPTPGHIAHNGNSLAITTLGEWTWLMNQPDITSAFSAWPEAISNYGKPHKRQIPHHIARNSDVPFFDYYINHNLMQDFTRAMSGYTRVNNPDIQRFVCESFDWTALGSGPAVDLGGGSGHIAVQIAQAHPQLHFVVQDLASNESQANATIPDELKDRVRFQTQDFFAPQADWGELQPKVFFMKAIMHDWPDEACLPILRHLMPYVERGAKILVHDRVLPAPGEKVTELDCHRSFLDALMFTLLDARERNRREWEELFGRLDGRLKMEVLEAKGNEGSLIVVGL